MDIDELVSLVALVFQRYLDDRIVLANFDIDVLLDGTHPAGSIDLHTLEDDIVLCLLYTSPSPRN